MGGVCVETGRGMSQDEGLVEVREGPPDPERRLCPMWAGEALALGSVQWEGLPRAKGEEAVPATEG